MRLEWHVLVHIKLMANYSIRTRERKVSRKTANIALHDYWMKFLYICTKFPSNQRRANRIQHTIQIVPGDFLYNMYICQLDWYVIYQFTSVLQDSYASLFPPRFLFTLILEWDKAQQVVGAFLPRCRRAPFPALHLVCSLSAIITELQINDL